jgi:hypothetical protein
LLPKKSFLAYLSVKLLRHYINRLGIVTIVEQVRVIQNLEFSESLKDLERYLGMTRYL